MNTGMWSAPRIIHFASTEGYEKAVDPRRAEYEKLKAEFEEGQND